MVTVKLYGGLGNQMSQYAAGLALADKLGSAISVDVTWFEEMRTNPHIITRREYELDIFEIYPRATTLRNRMNTLFDKPKTYKEKGLGYDPGFWKLSGNVVLDGHWLSYKYFNSRIHLIAEAFKFPSKVSKKNRDIIDNMQTEASISVHVRRADYANDAYTKRLHGLTPLEYYLAAIKKMCAEVKSPVFYIFSDDIDWCRKNIKPKGKIIYVSHNNGAKSYEDMRLMAACKNNIIANSSFSWWGAWLNPRRDKIVIAPRQWRKDGLIKTHDMIPENWIVL